MFYLSDVLKTQHDLDNFTDLLEIVRNKAREGELHMDVDIRPPFQDTPKDWQNQVEMAFTFPNRP